MAAKDRAATEPFRPDANRQNLCAVVAREQGEDPIGSAWATERMLVVEVPLPWPGDILEARALPPGLDAAVLAMYDTHPEVGMIAMAPDRDLGREGWSRVIDFIYPAPPRAAARRNEFLVVHERVAEFVAARLGDDPHAAATIPGVETREFSGRDLFVCTHGTVDACCALFGYPLFRDLRQAASATAGECRVWRSTHFGGHRFAPTVLDLPDGRYWGYITPELGQALVTRHGDVTDLRDSYRGWAGYAEPEAQVLEREAFVREGWVWRTWPQHRETLVQDEERGALLRITAFPPTGAPVVYEGWVDTPGSIETLFESGGELVQSPTFRVRVVRPSIAGGIESDRSDSLISRR